MSSLVSRHIFLKLHIFYASLTCIMSCDSLLEKNFSNNKPTSLLLLSSKCWKCKLCQYWHFFPSWKNYLYAPFFRFIFSLNKLHPQHLLTFLYSFTLLVCHSCNMVSHLKVYLTCSKNLKWLWLSASCLCCGCHYVGLSLCICNLYESGKL